MTGVRVGVRAGVLYEQDIEVKIMVVVLKIEMSWSVNNGEF